MRDLEFASPAKLVVLFLLLVTLLLITAPCAFVSWLRWKVRHHGLR